MAKYIVEIPDGIKVSEDLVPFDMCRPSWWDEAYKKGLNDTWKAVRKICSIPADGGLTWSDMEGIFGTMVVSEIFKRNTPFEVISKIREYEKKKKAEEEIKVGDEVDRSLGSGGYLRFIVLYESKGWLFGRRSDGGLESCDKSKARKTGRFFPRIAEYVKQINDEIEQIKENDE